MANDDVIELWRAEDCSSANSTANFLHNIILFRSLYSFVSFFRMVMDDSYFVAGDMQLIEYKSQV